MSYEFRSEKCFGSVTSRQQESLPRRHLMEVKLKKYRLPSKSALVALEYMSCLMALVIGFLSPAAFSQNFTMKQALSAPFPGYLSAAPAKGRIAWVANIDGRRNIWLAEPDAKGKSYALRQLTHYSEDDGQELSDLHWTPDAANIVYVRGGSAQGAAHPVPNPVWAPLGAKQQIWEIGADGGEPRLIADGNSPAIAPDGKTLAYLAGLVWTVPLDTPNAKPQLILQMRGSTRGLRWSPDSSRLALVSDRGDHSFIAVYSMGEKSLNYLDPSTNLDSDFVWSPDSTRIAILRIPSVKAAPNYYAIHRTGPPWSIRVADVSTGRGREVWRAADGVGSVYQLTYSEDQLHWVAGDRLVFPWERDGWLHFYAVSVAGGKASLLTPGDFEVEQVSMSHDRRMLVFGSNQGDIDREHIWRLRFAQDGSTDLPQALTSGNGIETYPAVVSDNATVAMLRSDAHLPLRAAVVEGGRLTDIAPQTIPTDFPGSRFVEPQQVIFPAADGLAIHGQLFLPPGLKTGERRPAVVYFHGGSRRQMLLGWHYSEYYSNVYAMNQYLASKGYVVLSVNYRSGTGYGFNFREALNYGPAGASEFNDVMGAALYLRSRSDVDGKRIGCWGGSWGGYLTALALARGSDLFAAGVDLHGIYDWGMILPELSPASASPEHLREAQIAFSSSPIASISSWRSPVLMIHGDDDRNAPFAETVQQAEALRKQGVDFEELIFPDEVHSFLLQRNWSRVYAAMTDFLDRKLIKEH
jgi:dipeptidyl aminopeptidase/acylaminoacyl peptidase